MSEGACAVIVFARAPVCGAVKTRLARDVGDARALELYRWLGARVLDGLVSASRGYRLIVAFTPGDALAPVQDWLPGADEYVAQGSGDLGARMADIPREAGIHAPSSSARTVRRSITDG